MARVEYGDALLQELVEQGLVTLQQADEVRD